MSDEEFNACSFVDEFITLNSEPWLPSYPDHSSAKQITIDDCVTASIFIAPEGARIDAATSTI
jgi:hypothetical protein